MVGGSKYESLRGRKGKDVYGSNVRRRVEGSEKGREGGKEGRRRKADRHVGRTYRRWDCVVVAKWGVSVAQHPCRLLPALRLRAAGTEAVVSSCLLRLPLLLPFLPLLLLPLLPFLLLWYWAHREDVLAE